MYTPIAASLPLAMAAQNFYRSLETDHVQGIADAMKHLPPRVYLMLIAEWGRIALTALSSKAELADPLVDCVHTAKLAARHNTPRDVPTWDYGDIVGAYLLQSADRTPGWQTRNRVAEATYSVGLALQRWYDTTEGRVQCPFQTEGGGWALARNLRRLGAQVGEVAQMFRAALGPDASFDPEWRTSTAVQLADQILDTGDLGLMPFLADALQDAGCDRLFHLDSMRCPTIIQTRADWALSNLGGFYC